MMPLFSRRLLVPVLCLMAWIPCCGPKVPLTVAMEYHPTSMLDTSRSGGALPTSGAAKLYVGDVADQRENKSAIGENREDEDKPGIPIHADADPGQLVRQALSRELAHAGLTVAEDKGQATRIVSADIVRFWCTETSTYDTEVRLRVRVADAQGKTLWEGVVGGTNRRFGRSLNARNYQETFSDSMVELMEHLLGDSGFRAAIK